MSDIVHPDSYLTLHYRLSLAAAPKREDGDDRDVRIVDTFGDKPATLQMGSGQLAPALEEKLLGLKTGDSASFALEAAEAFGQRNAELVQKISRAVFDGETAGDTDYRPGDVVEFNAPGGSRYAGVLKELNERYALFDFNHPLAGQPMRFDVKIVGVL